MAIASEIINKEYKKIIDKEYPLYSTVWPVLSGHDVLNGEYGNYVICVLRHTGNPSMMSSSVIVFNSMNTGVAEITPANIEDVREKVREYFSNSNKDSVVILCKDGSNLGMELEKMKEKHELIMGVKEMQTKLFLSHKGANKPMVRNYKKTLELLGFDVWLDEDAMPAGTHLHKGILEGFKASCAAIFFITPEYKDEGFLETEVGYAITEKMEKGNKFSIITLVYEKDGQMGEVPPLLKPYVWKTPEDDLEAIREIVKALPVKVGTVSYK